MFRKPWFWVAFTLISVLCTAWAVLNFARAFPLVTLNVTMDRAAAMAAADDLATTRGWGPSDPARQAVQFSLDNQVQSFVELEAGGKEAYTGMLAGDLYSPYTWGVRRFREGETNETLIRFRPDGAACGFRERVPEDEPGATLEPDAAQALAEAAVADGWDVDLSRVRTGRGLARGPARRAHRSHPGLRTARHPDRRRSVPLAAFGVGRPLHRAHPLHQDPRGLQPPLCRDAVGKRRHRHRLVVRHRHPLHGRRLRRRALLPAQGTLGGLETGPQVGALYRLPAGAGGAQPVAFAVDGLRHGDLIDDVRTATDRRRSGPARRDGLGARALLHRRRKPRP